MKWLTRSLFFLAVALLFVAVFLGLNRAGAFSSFEMNGPPPWMRTADGTTGASTRPDASASGVDSPAAPRGDVAPGGRFPGGPRGEHGGGFNLPELGKDLGLVAVAWLALGGLDRLNRSNRAPARP
ncbi:hypothetical protein [Deinococcus pimensis]|uniref:hypothetical protein n=1 Tax=Deinococcus pimensis TaxID=309888 RepID=UPI0004876F90|nr:hypothetical protein [Deinococcus pimensis]